MGERLAADGPLLAAVALIGFVTLRGGRAGFGLLAGLALVIAAPLLVR